MLLGADLESNRNRSDKDFAGCMTKCDLRGQRGWCNSFLESQNHRFVGKYCYVKISHHSSETGYCPRLWSEKVTDDVVGTSTVFYANLLPQRDMVDLYTSRCKEYYLSAPLLEPQKTIENQEIECLKEDGVVRRVLVPAGERGTISSRYSLSSKQYLCVIETCIGAFIIRDEIFLLLNVHSDEDTCRKSSRCFVN